jgi:hypothetical protein
MAQQRSLSDECLDYFVWRTWVAVKTIVQRECRGGESQRNVVALLTPIMSSLVGGARQHARMPLVGREETREKPRRAHPGLRRRLFITAGLVSKAKGGGEGRHGHVGPETVLGHLGDESVRAGSGCC